MSQRSIFFRKYVKEMLSIYNELLLKMWTFHKKPDPKHKSSPEVSRYLYMALIIYLLL